MFFFIVLAKKSNFLYTFSSVFLNSIFFRMVFLSVTCFGPIYILFSKKFILERLYKLSFVTFAMYSSYVFLSQFYAFFCFETNFLGVLHWTFEALFILMGDVNSVFSRLVVMNFLCLNSLPEKFTFFLGGFSVS